jgi:hypothetical protein
MKRSRNARREYGTVRKRRTRQHVIADLSVNHVERFAHRCGHSVERSRSDYGLDLTLFTYNRRGEVENGVVYLQLKATDRLPPRGNRNTIAVRVHRSDLLHWLAEPQPIILVAYDATADRAYWLYVQAYFEAMHGFRLSKIGESTTVHMDVRNVAGEDAIRKFVSYRDDVARQQRGKVRHHA